MISLRTLPQRVARLFILLVFALFVLSPSSTSAATLTIFSTGFNAGAPTEFSGVTTTESVLGYGGLGPSGYQFGGNFLRNNTGGSPNGTPSQITTLTLTGLPTHTSIDVRFLLALIDTWDGTFSVPMAPVPDLLNVRVDGNLIFSHSFSNWHLTVNQSYSPPAGVLLTSHPYSDLGWQVRTDFGESAYDMSADPVFQAIAHTASTLTVEWWSSGGGWQGGLDESWALDNVEIVLNGVPDVPALGLPGTTLFLVLLAAGWCMRNRRMPMAGSLIPGGSSRAPRR